jgi:hypothetical protein
MSGWIVNEDNAALRLVDNPAILDNNGPIRLVAGVDGLLAHQEGPLHEGARPRLVGLCDPFRHLTLCVCVA